MRLLGVVVLVVALTGCDKLKSMAGKDADGGASSSSGGGGILSFLDSDFEGEITMLPTSKGKVGGPIVLSMKKPKYRTDMTQGAGAPNSSIILDAPSKKATMLMHASKTAMVVDLDQVKKMAGQFSNPNSAAPTDPSQPKAPPPTFTNTGKKDTVAGYACDVWKMTTSDGKTGDACMAEKITWVDIGAIGGFTSLGIFASEANHLPLRFVGYDAKGAEETRIEAQKIEKKKLDDAAFTVPADYKVMDMGAMMNGFMGGAGGKPGTFPPGFPSQPPKQH